MAKTYKSKKPTGLAFSRKGNVVTLAWKCGDSDYNAQQQIGWSYYKWKFKYDKKKKKNVGNTEKDKTSNGFKNIGVQVRSYNFKFNPKAYYPYTNNYLTVISVSVRGKRKNFKQNNTDYTCQMSDYTNLQYKPLAPNPPRVYASPSDEYDNATTFSWASPDSDTGLRIFSDYARQTVVIKDCNTANGSKVKWSGAKLLTGLATSQFIREDLPFQGFYSYTRWYRVRCRGPRGNSEWRYARHVYAMPAYATDVVAKVEYSNAARGLYRINVIWTATASVAHPIDKTTVEYLETAPTSTITTKTNAKGVEYRHIDLTPPPFTGGTEAATIKDSPGKDGVVISVPTLAPYDNCVVVRVNTHHDNNVGLGATTYVKNSFGKLNPPEITNIGSLDPLTKRISISINNTSEVDNTHVAVIYKTEEAPGKEMVVGIIPKGQSTATIILPDSCLTSNYQLGVRTRLGDYSPVEPLESSYTVYTLSNEIMTSSKVWGEGTVPQPPKNITLTSPSTGTIRVTWDWSWKAATGAELSWSTHRDAWESTDEPTTYIVNNTSASAWNISNLDIGTWYVRIRLFKSSDNGTIYGAYSEIEEIKLAAAPDTPSLTLSEPVIPETGSVTCYWVYTTNDGTNQNYAEICEATMNQDGTFNYGDVIAHANTTQYLTLYPENLGWHSGETHYLAVRVTSASGETSENWSTPVSLAIADKIDIHIGETSLVDITETREAEGETVIDTYKALTSMPLTISVKTDEDEYVLTSDTEVEAGKAYFIRLGSGTEQDPYIYTEVAEPESNPSSAGYYEKSEINGEVTLIIERAESYHMARPDESDFDGFEGETIAIISKENTGSISFERSDLLGILDDGAKYNLIATLKDSYGQTAISDPLLFKVKWAHQAVIPEAEVESFSEGIYSTILPITPVAYELTSDVEVVEGKTYYTRSGEGTEEDPYVYSEVSSPSGNPHELGYFQIYNSSSDTCDIYRLSVDAPVLIYKDALFGTKYVDPYPTIQNFGGYRIVYRTVDGDYITDENNLAWTDYMDGEEQQIDVFATIIDFSKERIILPYDIALSNSWAKDFVETKYLGGSIQGDWNPTVSRTGSVKTNTITFEDPETIKSMRRLAEYAGICHVRTPDGSNFTANVNVSEDRENRFVNKLAKFSLDITRVDPEDLDGETYESWASDNE